MTYPKNQQRWTDEHYQQFYKEHKTELDALLKADGLDTRIVDWHTGVNKRAKKMYINTLPELIGIAPTDYETLFQFTRKEWPKAPLSRILENIPQWRQSMALKKTPPPHSPSPKKEKPKVKPLSVELAQRVGGLDVQAIDDGWGR